MIYFSELAHLESLRKQAVRFLQLHGDTPIEGYYRFKLVKGGHPVGIRIWFGQPLDPDTRELMDRALRLNAECNGDAIDIDRVWPWCGTDPIDAQEYKYYCGLAYWAKINAPLSPQANTKQPVNLLTAPLPF